MLHFNLDQFRTTTETGGVLAVLVVAHGGVFHIEVETRRGNAVLTKARGDSPREFRDATKALELLRGLGVCEARIDMRNWRPEQAALGRVARPDRSARMKEAHEAAALKRVLDAAIAEADAPDAVWHDVAAIFEEMEARYAR